MLTANGQQSESVLDQLEGKQVKYVDSSAYYTEGETYAIKIVFEDDTELLLRATTVKFDQYSSSPIINIIVKEMDE